MIEKIFFILLLAFVSWMFYERDQSLNFRLKDYYYCVPNELNQNPPIPPLTKNELENFDTTYQDFSLHYSCQIKPLTVKQFSIMRKATK